MLTESVNGKVERSQETNFVQPPGITIEEAGCDLRGSDPNFESRFWHALIWDFFLIMMVAKKT